ncbi:hypothetical protein TRAPUB_11217 [Trametes pubescens]|uniref:MYND-type domain-containing protein n=1 Tax=Trametes pubescens TaxID=154538 RepID=A0A1M2VX90_TRAPU|nr:hypothetical protein TRAPUB_11217 [Trametes pubescens]
MYCSKECQKNGWLGHRDFCRRSDDPNSPRADGHSFSGYPSAITLGNAIKLWVEIHNYGFTVVTNTVILLNNDIQPSDFSREIWAYLFVLDVGANSQGPDGNPAKAFQLLQTSLVRKEELGPLSDEWDEMVNHCRLAAAARREEDPVHLLAAYLPAIFVMANTGLTTRHHFPVYLPRREDAFSLDGTYRSIIADAHRMCSEAMNAGDIFRVPLSGIYKHTPDLGTVVKHGKKNKWRWESRDENAYWDALSRRMTHKDSPYQSGLTPREIWARFQGL